MDDKKENATPQCACACGSSKIWIVAMLVLAVGIAFYAKQKRAPASAPATATGLPALIDLDSDKCIPCKMMAPILSELKREYAGRLDVQFIDVWEDKNAGERYAVRTIPTQIFYDAAGKELFRHEGFFAKDEILAKWKELGVSFAPIKVEAAPEKAQ